MTNATSGDMADVFMSSGSTMLGRLGVGKESDLVDQVFERAVTWADKNAAALVTGVTESTRDDIRDAIASGLEDNIGYDEIIERIQEAGIFDEDRAELIARTEIADANQQGALEGMRQAQSTGLVVKKSWYPDEDACPICLDNADAGEIDIDDDFPSGDDAPTAHPNCECSILEHSYESEEEAKGGDEEE